MSANVKNRTRLAVGASVGFAIALVLALTLLLTSKFSGAEFTAFVLAFAVLAVAIGFAPEVQEISIVGNVVKLKEVKAEALEAIESLNESRAEMLRMFLELSLKHGGGFGADEVVDPRNKHFWEIVALARKYKCLERLRDAIGDALKNLMATQIMNLQRRNDDSYDVYPYGKEIRSLPDPFTLSGFVTASEGIAKASARYSGKNLLPEINDGLQEYLRLDQLRAELNISREIMGYTPE